VEIQAEVGIRSAAVGIGNLGADHQEEVGTVVLEGVEACLDHQERLACRGLLGVESCLVVGQLEEAYQALGACQKVVAGHLLEMGKAEVREPRDFDRA